MGEPAPAERKPRPPTLRQERLAQTTRTAKTKRQALLEAGYSPSTANKNPTQILSSQGYSVSRDTLLSKELDSASRVHNLGLQAFEKRIRDDSISDAGIAAAVKVTHDIKQADAGTEQLLTGADREAANTYIRLVVRACIASSCDHNQVPVLPIDDSTIDSIALAVERGELTQYTLSDAGPPTTLDCVPTDTDVAATDTVADNAVDAVIVSSDEPGNEG